ncbi:MAG: DUF1365 domain-containing protein [Pseudomonadota bacterium]
MDSGDALQPVGVLAAHEPGDGGLGPADAASPGAPGGAPDHLFEPRIFVGSVSHARLKPVRHAFKHAVFSLWLDVDRLAETAGRLRFFGLNRFNLIGFSERAHGPRDGGPLRPWVEERLREIDAPAPRRIMALCLPRMLGYEFNPLTTYYCYDAEGRLTALVYEVKNTIGGQHAYPVRLDPAAETRRTEPLRTKKRSRHRHERRKAFYVSPFIEMAKTYRFDVVEPGDRLSLRITESDAEGQELIAVWEGRAEPLSDGRILRRMVSHPLLSLRVIGLIHWHAIRLLWKGAPMIGRRMASPEAQRGSSSTM